MTHNVKEYDDIIRQLKELEESLQDNKSDYKDLKRVVDSLKDIVERVEKGTAGNKDVIVSLDKDTALISEKLVFIFFRLEQLQKELESLDGQNTKQDDKSKARMENIIMLILGGVVTYFFSLIKN